MTPRHSLAAVVLILCAQPARAQDCPPDVGPPDLFASPELLFSGTVDAVDFVLGDLDGDGYLDAVVAYGAAAPAEVWLQEPDGTWLHWGDVSTGVEALSLQLIDVDSDFDLDLSVVDPANELIVYTNDGSADFSPLAQIGAPLLPGPQAAAWGQLDFDEDPELVLVDGSAVALVYEDLLTQQSNNTPVFSAAWPDASGVAMAQFQPYGDLQVALGFASDFLRVLDGPGLLLTVTPPPMVSQDPLAATELALADLDGDGETDVLVTTDTGVSLQRQFGGILVEIGSLPLAGASSPAAEDVDGDGFAEFAVVHGGAVSLYTSSDPAAPTLVATWSTDTAYTVRFGDSDSDGDGNRELLALTDAGLQRLHEWPTAYRLKVVDANPPPGPPRDVAWADMDGDADLDLAVLWQDRLRVYENVNGALSLCWSTVDNRFTLGLIQSASALAWGDFMWSGDTLGRLDLVVSQESHADIAIIQGGGRLFGGSLRPVRRRLHRRSP